jgi:diguanylate cyclase (GGDEF)-like protein
MPRAVALGIAVVMAPGMARAQASPALPAAGWWVAAAVALALGIWVAWQRRQARVLSSEIAVQRAALGSVQEAVIGIDAEHSIRYLNDAGVHLVGRSGASVQGSPWLEVFRLSDPDTREPLAPDVLLREAGGAETVEPKALLVDAQGIERLVEVKCASEPPGASEQLRFITLRDVGVPYGASLDLFWQASHDALTGLLNRREFMHRLEILLDEMPTQPQDEQHILLFIDLDRFKLINDSSGHAAGDEFLRQIVAVLRERVRESDVLARIGGDEFCVLLEACPIEQALRIANAIRLGVANFRFVWRDKTFHVGTSIGLVPITRIHASAEDIIEHADRACYAAKDSGGDQVRVFPTGTPPTGGRLDVNILETVHNALEQEGFRLYRQRIAWLQGDEGAVTHYELLLRMVGPNGQTVPPMAFIPAAERHHMMQAIDRWVLRHAFPAILRERALIPREPPVFSINLSAASINDPRFPAFVREQVQEHQVPPACICFEVTETLAVANLAKAAELIHDLKAQGFRFALDDFGTGMCSFAYLKHLPVDYLKIDGAFVRDMTGQPIDFEIVCAINNIAHALGMKTVAEFVEDEHTLSQLQEIGVDYAQGQAVGRPVLLA